MKLLSLSSLLLPCLLVIPIPGAAAALSLHSLFSPVDVSFSGFTAPATWAASAPTAGQLDSSQWSLLADGPLTTTPATFGIDLTGGQGSSTGSESTAGVYAFDVEGGVTAMGVQPTASFWTPGMFTLRLQNNTGHTVTSLDVDWTAWVYNDQGRSNSVRLLHSADNATYSPVDPAFDVISPAEASPAPVVWHGTPRSLALTDLSLAPGEHYYLRWGGDDVGGAGSRDELGIAGIRVTPVPEPGTLLLLALTPALARRRR